MDPRKRLPWPDVARDVFRELLSSLNREDRGVLASLTIKAILWLRSVMALLGVLIVFWAFLHWNSFLGFLIGFLELMRRS
jgi:ABC-type multidrug transport system permease subunit